MPDLVVGYLNLYGSNRTPRAAVTAMTSTRADTIGFGEAPRWLDLLRGQRRYRLHMGNGGRDRRRGHRDTPILTRRDRPSLGSAALQISEAAKPARLAPDRWLTASCFPAAGLRVAHLNLHPNAAVMGVPAASQRVGEYIESMRAFERTIRYYREVRQFTVVVTGDLNFRFGRADDGPLAWDDRWSPYAVMERRGLDWHDEGIDAIAWDRDRLARAGTVRVIPERVTGSDHPALVVTLRAV